MSLLNKKLTEIITKVIKNSRIKISVSDLPIKLGSKMYYKINFTEENIERLSFYLLFDDILEGKYK